MKGKLQTLTPAEPDRVVLMGLEPCPKHHRWWGFSMQGTCEFVVEKALGKDTPKARLAVAVIVKCKHCGARMQVQLLNGPQ